MKLALVALILSVVACADGPWPDVPGARVTPVGRQGWDSAVDAAVQNWNLELEARGCPTPFVIVAIGGHPIELVAGSAWTHDDDEAGMEMGDRIDIKDLRPDADPIAWALPFLLHELGHALGLRHRDVGATVMWPAPFVDEVQPIDVDAAVESLGCP